MIMIMIKELLLRRISSGLIGALHTLQLKEKFNETLYIVYEYEYYEYEYYVLSFREDQRSSNSFLVSMFQYHQF